MEDVGHTLCWWLKEQASPNSSSSFIKVLSKNKLHIVLDCGPLAVDHGPWTEDSGPWTVDWGLRAVDPEQRTQDSEQRIQDSEQRTMDQGCNWELTTKDQGQWIKAKHGGWTFILYLNILISRYIWYCWWQRWHSAPCPEGFSPGTPVSLTLEKPLFSNSNLTKLATIWLSWQQFNKIGDNLTKLMTM